MSERCFDRGVGALHERTLFRIEECAVIDRTYTSFTSFRFDQLRGHRPHLHRRLDSLNLRQHLFLLRFQPIQRHLMEVDFGQQERASVILRDQLGLDLIQTRP